MVCQVLAYFCNVRGKITRSKGLLGLRLNHHRFTVILSQDFVRLEGRMSSRVVESRKIKAPVQVSLSGWSLHQYCRVHQKLKNWVTRKVLPMPVLVTMQVLPKCLLKIMLLSRNYTNLEIACHERKLFFREE